MSIITEVAVGAEGDICLVCGMPLEGVTVVSYDHNGDRLVFCSNDCLKEFMMDPEKYLVDDEDEE